MLLLGDRGVGKRSLIKEINAKYVLGKNKSMAVEKMGSDFSALDFSFIYVKDLTDKEQAASYVTGDDNLSRLNIWTLQDSTRGDLLEQAIQPGSLENTLAVIMLDLDEPVELMQSLTKWMSTLQQSLFNLFPQMEAGTFERMKQKIKRLVQTYEEP